MIPSLRPVDEPVRITVIAPVVLPEDSDDFFPVVEGVVFDHRSLAAGTDSIESRWDDQFSVPGIIDAAMRAEGAGAEAVIIDCMDDPGLDTVREVVRIPVVGPAEASMHLALCLAGRFTILTTADEDIPVVREIVERNRLEHRSASIRGIGISPLQLHEDPEKTFRRFAEVATIAVREDGTEAIIAGCTLLSDLIDRLSEHLVDVGLDVPVIDPRQAAAHHARMLVRLGLSHSAVSYPAPPPTPIVWPGPEMRFGVAGFERGDS